MEREGQDVILGRQAQQDRAPEGTCLEVERLGKRGGEPGAGRGFPGVNRQILKVDGFDLDRFGRRDDRLRGVRLPPGRSCAGFHGAARSR